MHALGLLAQVRAASHGAAPVSGAQAGALGIARAPPPACVELLTRVYPQPAEEGEQGGEAAEANPEDAAISAMVTSTADDWERCAVGCIPDVAVMR